MKILFYISNIKGGGAARVMSNIANELSKGNEIVFVTNFPAEHEYKLNDCITRVNLVQHELKSNAIMRNHCLIKELRKILKCEAPNVAVSFMGENNVRLLFANAGLNIKTIISVRNDPRREYPSSKFPKLTDFLYQKADRVVFQTEDAKAFFSEKVQSKSQIIFNQVDAKFYQKIEQPGRYIVACGRLSKQKNYPMMLDAFKIVHERFPNEKLRIYGDGNMKNELVAYRDKLGLAGSVDFMGFSTDMTSVYRDAKMLVMSSDYEGMPNVVLEALASSVPVVSTDCPCGGPRMIIKNGVNGYLVPVGNVQKFAGKIIDLLIDNDKLLALKQNAYSSAGKFDGFQIITSWKKFIEQVTNNECK